MLAYLYETTAIIDADGTTKPIRFSSGAGYNHPSAPGFAEGRILGASDASSGVSVLRTVFSNGAFGGGDITFGSVQVANPDSGLDALLDYGFGQPATLKIGEEDGPYSDFQTILSGRATQVTVSDTTLSFGWQSRLAELDNPACPATFAGTNSGTDGLEGLTTDIMGQNKPWTMGAARNLTPVLLNSSTRIFGWNFATDGTRLPTHSVDAVRFAGSLWTFGVDFTDAASLEAATPTVGIYNTCLAESLVQIGGSNDLNGKITFDVTIEATAAERYAGSLWKALLLRAGVPSDHISDADVAALNTAAPYEAYYYAQGQTYREIADALAASVAATYLQDRLNVYRIEQMSSPSGTPVAGFKRLTLDTVAKATDGDLISLAPVSAGTDWTPLKQVRVAYAPNLTTFAANEVADGVDADDRAFLTTEWRYTAPAISAEATAKYGNALTKDFQTYLASADDAAAIAAVLLGIFGTQRREYQATVTYGAAFAALLDLGSIVEVTSPKFGMSAGKLAAVHAIRLRDDAQIAELKLWL